MNSPTQLRARLAPSPTGGLHIGNVRTLLLAWLSARSAGGTVILRVEDIDRARCRPEHTARMVDDLRWLGLDWDEGPGVGGPHAPYEQSGRYPAYRAALDRLIASGHAYACTCSRADLAQSASAPHGPDGPTYPGTCRSRYADAAEAVTYAGRPPAWRFDASTLPIRPWKDAFRPDLVMPAAVDDFVLWRADEVPSYQLAVAVDDIAMGVSEVVRGDDLIPSTPRQLALIDLLGGRAPVYRHVPLVLDDQGHRMAKRDGSLTVAGLQSIGITAERLVGFLAQSLGLQQNSDPVTPTGLAPTFRWEDVSHSSVTLTQQQIRAPR